MRMQRPYIHILLRIMIFLLISLLTIMMCKGPFDYGDNKSMLVRMEKMINSKTNQGECQIPNLPLDSPELVAFYSHYSLISCGKESDDWVTCKKSLCSIKPFVAMSRGNITCLYTNVFRKTDRKLYYGKAIQTNGDYHLNQSDFVNVHCTDEIGVVWTGLASGIRNSVHRPMIPTKFPPYNVLMIGFGSLSRNAFIRILPKSYEYLVNNLGSMVLQGYNVVGDGSQQAIIPLLTGLTELELPEVRRRKPNSLPLNVLPMIWKEFEKNGYYTAFNEDVFGNGVFTERLTTFHEKPTDHFLRTLFLEANTIVHENNDFCIDSKPFHSVVFDYTKNFMDKYADHPRFAFSFHSQLSDDFMRFISNADEKFVDFLKNLKVSGYLNNTFLIVMSDHGYRFSDSNVLLQGKQEERLPFFSFRLPDTFKIRHPEEYRNFQENVQRLTTPFDIHETLVHILRLQSIYQHKPTSEQPTHGISLFDQIPKNRSCADAYIPPQWCACLNLIKMNDTSSPMIANMAESVLTQINFATGFHRRLCQLLEIKQINSVVVVTPSKELLKFKESKDIDEFVPDFSSDMEKRIINQFYQIEFETKPGGLVFRATVSLNTKSLKLKTRLSQVLRVNDIDDQAICMRHLDKALRKFCYCK